MSWICSQYTFTAIPIHRYTAIQIYTDKMSHRMVIMIILVLLSRAAARTVLFNYNSDFDTVIKNIDTFTEDTEELDDGMRLFLEGVKLDLNLGKEEKKVEKIRFEGDIFRRFFNPSIVDAEESPDEVEILKIWKIEDLQ